LKQKPTRILEVLMLCPHCNGSGLKVVSTEDLSKPKTKKKKNKK